MRGVDRGVPREQLMSLRVASWEGLRPSPRRSWAAHRPPPARALGATLARLLLSSLHTAIVPTKTDHVGSASQHPGGQPAWSGTEVEGLPGLSASETSDRAALR